MHRSEGRKKHWYEMGRRLDALSTKHKRELLDMLKMGIHDTEVLADKLRIPQERLERYIARVKQRKLLSSRKHRASSNLLGQWAAVFRKQVGRRLGCSATGLWYPVTQALEHKAETLSKSNDAFTVANMYRFMALASPDRPLPPCTELMSVLFKFFTDRLQQRLSTMKCRPELEAMLATKGAEIAQFKVRDGPKRVYWTGQGRPPPGYDADAYLKAENEALSMGGGQGTRAAVILNCLEIPAELLEKLSKELFEPFVPTAEPSVDEPSTSTIVEDSK